jgi:hypothetical protein
MAGLFGGGLERIRRQAGYLAPRVAREEERMTPAPIMQGTQARTRDEAQMGGLIGGSYKSPRAQGWWNEIMADPFTALLAGRNGLDRKYEAQAAEDEARRMAPQMQWMEQFTQGLPDQQRFAAMTAPGDLGKEFAKGAAPQTGTFWDGRQWNQKPQDMMTVSDGAAVFDPNSGAPVFSNRAPPGPKYFNTGQAVVSVEGDKANVLYRDPQNAGGSQARLRAATPEEAAKYGPPGTMGQIDMTTGRFYPTSRPNPQTGGLPTEGERKFGLYAKTARDALADIEAIEFGNGFEADPTFDRGGELNPFNGTARKYDQAIDRFLDGWSRAMTGAAMTMDEKLFYYGIMKPTFGDDPSVRKQKAAERRAMVERLKEAAARGYTEPASEPIVPSLSPDEEAELEALRAELGMQ